MPFSAKSLSNRYWPLLWKQVLKMKKRSPVFAIGKSNKVNGLAEAIKVHFQKYPLATVNVKGRAKGTSFQEVVFRLEQLVLCWCLKNQPKSYCIGAGEQETGLPMVVRNLIQI